MSVTLIVAIVLGVMYGGLLQRATDNPICGWVPDVV